MKTLRQHLLVLGALCSATCFFGKDAGPTAAAKPLHHDHEVLSYIPTAFTREFAFASGGKVSVSWKWTGEDPTTHEDIYDCTIRQNQDPTSAWGYSLYTLGIQGRLWKVHVSSVSGSNVVFTPGPKAAFSTASGPGGLSATLPAACKGNPPAPASHKPPEPDRIGFITFTGPQCTLVVRTERVRHGPRTKSSHDATPPPPEGGSEN